MGAPPWLLLLLGGPWAPPAFAGSHSLRYYRSALSQPIPGHLQYFSAGFVDDVQITLYTGGGGKAEPRVFWVEAMKSEFPEYWVRCKSINQSREEQLRRNLKSMMKRLNQTRGLHVVQYIHGCELREDGSIETFYQHAYDGHDLLRLDNRRLMFTAALDPARVAVDGWNSDRMEAQYWKSYLEEGCIKYLRKYLEIGAKSLEKRVRPELRVSRTKAGVDTTLTCYAYGFYPREIEVKWVRNGVEMPWKSKQILPHPDGTYQVKTTVEIYEGDDERNYTCQVEHSSLEKILNVEYVPTEKSSPGTIWSIVGSIVVVVLLLVAIFGWRFFSKRIRSGRRPPT